MRDHKIIVGSGWWSTSEPNPWLIGSEITRAPEFFGLWLHLVEKYIRPSQIVVVNSNSPRLPPSSERSKVTWLDLDKNYGHSNDIRTGVLSGKYCGVTRAILLGATFAFCNDADLFCYVEQGCLIRGADFIDAALAGRQPTIMMGAPPIGGRGLHGRVAVAMHQTSLMLVGRDALPRFISAIAGAPEADGEISPEDKLAKHCTPFQLLAIPFGRSRPVDVSALAFYIKHATDDELDLFLEAEGLRASQFGIPIRPTNT